LEQDGARTPILAVSAGDELVDRERCFAAGMDGYVAKPIRPASLNRAISTALAAGLAPRRSAPVPAGPKTPASEMTTLSERAPPAVALDEGVVGSIRAAFGDDEFKTALNRTLDEATDIVAKIRYALHARDFAGAQRLAHGLKGMASNWGAPLLADRARHFVDIAEETADLGDPVDELDRQITAARRALDAFGGTGSQRACA
jgi:CheY-like chemotaxis protein